MSFEQFVTKMRCLGGRVRDLSRYFVLVTGKVKDPNDKEIKVGWLIRFTGAETKSVFDGTTVVRIVQNLDPRFPANLPLHKNYVCQTLTNFRKEAFPVCDTMGFDQTSFIVVPEIRLVTRLHRLLSYLHLPRMNTTPVKSVSEGKKKKTRRHKRTYKYGTTNKFIEKMLDRIILPHQKSIQDIRETLKIVKITVLDILDKKIQALDQADEMEKEEERKEAQEEQKRSNSEENVSFEQIEHLLEDSQNTESEDFLLSLLDFIDQPF